MTAASASARQPGAADRGAEAGRMRLRAYLLCLLAAFAVHVFVHVLSRGPVAVVLCAAVAALLLLALAASPLRPGGRLLVSAAALGASALAVLVPLGELVAGGAPLPAAIAGSAVWPQILVLLFAGRILAELAELRFAAFWTSPLDGGGRVETQSMAAALALGCCLTLIFYQFVGGVAVAPERLDPWAVAVRAFAGQTAIHVAIVLLFFVVLAAIVDAALLSLADRLALGDLRRLCRDHIATDGRLTAQDIAALASGRLGHAAHTRAMRFVREAARPGAAAAPARALDLFHLASRRLIRSLISFLPLLGFLGTVIGLTAAIGGLPDEIGPQARGSLDIAGSLFGLAVKFETTLLGLAGGLAASLLLSLLEKREEELAAECRRLVEAFSHER